MVCVMRGHHLETITLKLQRSHACVQSIEVICLA